MLKKGIRISVIILVIGLILFVLANVKKEDKEVPQEELESALLHIRITSNEGVENYAGGFIIDMDAESIVICSNAHVLSIAEQGTAYFVDGSSATFECMGYDEVHDVGLARIDKGEVPKECLKVLTQIPISKERWELFLQQGGSLHMTLLGKEGVVERKEGEAVAFVQNKYFEDTVLQVTVPIIPGNSGSAIVDEMGYLVGIAVGEVREVGFDNEYYAAPLTDIAAVYEELMGHELY